MFKIYLFLFLVLATTLSLKAQQNVNFENVNLGSQGYYNGSDFAGGFESGGLFFRINYDSSFGGFWDGIAAASNVDTVTPGFTNQYSTFAGVGANGSSKFGLVYVASQSFFRNANPAQAVKLNSFQFTNSTFAALSMKSGDLFSKKFGGLSGNDPDYLRIKVYNYFNGLVTDTAELYLADYRSSNNSLDYIQKNWREATFNFSSPFDSIGFKLESTDFNSFGIKTPAYFCIDEVKFSNTTSVGSVIAGSEKRAYPNPFNDEIVIKTESEIWGLLINDQLGRKVDFSASFNGNAMKMETKALPKGIYYLQIPGKATQKLIKE